MKHLLLSIAAVIIIIFNTVGMENKQEPVIIQEASASSNLQNSVEEDTNDMLIPNPTNDMLIPNPAMEYASFNFQGFFTILLVLAIANGGCLLLAKKNDLLSMKNDLLPVKNDLLPMKKANKSNHMK